MQIIAHRKTIDCADVSDLGSIIAVSYLAVAMTVKIEMIEKIEHILQVHSVSKAGLNW